MVSLIGRFPTVVIYDSKVTPDGKKPFSTLYLLVKYNLRLFIRLATE